MATAAEQQAWSTQVAKNQNAAVREEGERDNEEQSSDAASKNPAAAVANQGLQVLTLWVLRILAADAFLDIGIASLEFSWIGLLLYTLVKDLGKFSFMADPGDVLFVFLPPKAIIAMPPALKTNARLFMRIVIYPVGILISAAYLILIAIPVMIADGFAHPASTLAKLLGL